MDELAKINVNGKEYRLKDETARQGSSGNVDYPNWSHLKWYVMGDSLTDRNADHAEKRYYDFVQEKTGIQLIVDGIGGTGYGAGVSNGQTFVDRVKNIPEDVDIVSIFGSGNDIRYGVDYEKPPWNALSWIATNRPGLRVIVAPPLAWKSIRDGDGKIVTDYSKRGELWKPYCDRLQVCALACDFRYLSDLYDCPPFNPNFEGHMEKFFTTDSEGIHPNEAGHEALATYFYNALAQELEFDASSGVNSSDVNGSGGNTIYYMDHEVKYPVDGINFFNVTKNSLSNSGVGIKVGDIIVASNGTLCKATSVESGSKGLVRYDPIGTISGVIADGGTAGNDGYSTYYADVDLPHPMESEEGLRVLMSKLSNEGAGIKVGDLIIDSNGTLCKVTEVLQDISSVRCYSLASIGGTDSGGKDGCSIYHIDLVVPFPYEGEGVTAISKLSDGDGVKVGDLVISSNGTLCKVTEVTKETDRMKIRPINGSGGDSDVLVVTVTDNIASHSPAEIGEAYSEGKAVYLLHNRYVIPLSYYRDDVAYFNIPLNLSGTEPDINLTLRQYSVNADKSVSLSASSRNLPPCPTDEDEGKVLTAKNGDFVWSEHSGSSVEDGFSPTATVTQTDSGAVISITDKNGETTATITNGQKGDPGDDYILTDADKAEIAELTAGLVEIPDERRTPEAFGAVGDGTTDDTAAIRSCINYANEHGLEVKFTNGKKYKVNQKTSIVAHCSIDFNGSTIILNGGSINPFIKIEPLTKNTYTLTADSLTEYAVTDEKLFNKCMTIVSPISLGIRGGATGGNRPFTQTLKTDMNGNFINGKLECEIIPGSYNIKNVHDYLIQTLEIKNVTVDYSQIPDNDTAIFINSYRSNVKFDNINIVGDIPVDDWSYAVLGISNSCNIEISNIRGNSPYSKGGSGYIVGLYETADVYMHDCDFGGSTTQWGCIGVDYISNFVAERVNTNRFDCHYYFTGYFTVRDCTTNLALFCGGNGEMSYERVNFIRAAAGYTVERREDLVIMPSGIVKFSECTFDGGGAFKWECPTPDADLLTNIKYEFTHFVFENCKIHTPDKIFAIFDMESGWNNVLVDIINTNVGKRSLESWGASKVKRAIIRGCTFSQRIEVQGCDELIITECSGDTIRAVKDKVESCVLYGNILTPTVDTLIQSNSAIIANNMILADQPLTLKSGLKYIVANNLPLYDTYKSSWENKNN